MRGARADEHKSKVASPQSLCAAGRWGWHSRQRERCSRTLGLARRSRTIRVAPRRRARVAALRDFKVIAQI
jgi:hypothetical protein